MFLALAGCADAARVCSTTGGAGAGPPQLVFDQSAYDLGAPLVQQPSELAIAVTNAGDAATGALHVAVTPGRSADFAVDSTCCAGQPLAAGASCLLVVVFTPVMAGQQAATLTVSAAPGSTTSAILSGTGMDLQGG